MVEIAAGVGVVRARRDGVGVFVAAVVTGAVVVPSALFVLTSLVPVDVTVLSSAESAVAFVLVPSSALAVSLLVASACACCPAVACGWMASAMADIGNVALTMDVHAIAQIR